MPKYDVWFLKESDNAKFTGSFFVSDAEKVER